MAERGRPKRNAIDRFNIAVDLTDNRKFALFLECSGMSEGLALLTIMGLWKFVATNYAFDGEITLEWNEEAKEHEIAQIVNPKLRPDDGPALRKHCYFQGPSEMLISNLQKSGFLGPDLTVNGWFENQPLASKIVVKRTLAAIGGKKSAERRAASRAPIKDDSLGLKGDSLGFMDSQKPSQSLIPNPKEKIETTGVVSGERRGEPPPTPDCAVQQTARNGHNPFAQTAETIAMFLEEVSELVTLNNNDQTGIAFDVKTFLSRASPDDWKNLQHWITEQLRIAKREGRLNVEEHGIKNTVAWIRSQIKSELSPIPT